MFSIVNMAKMKKVSRLTKIRRLVQLIFIGAIGQWAYYGIFRCPFIVPLVNCQSCPIVTCWGRIATVFFGFWLFIPVLVIFLGRAFCGWLCPGGFVNQMLGKFAAFKLKLKNNKKLRYAQIGMVLAVLLSAGVYFIYGNPRVMIPIRTSDEYLNAVIMSFKFSDWYWAVRTAVVVALIAASLIVANLWCRFACPSGGIMELLRKISIFRVYKTDACDNCNACLRKCEMGTRPGEMNCTNCGDCMDVCHADAIKFGRKKRLMNFFARPSFDNHPCFSKKASAAYGRVHLPVAPHCNIQCNFCNRIYDCANENRPGVTGRVQSPDEAALYVENLFKFRQDISVIGIAGPGDPMCNADKTLATFEKCKARFPHALLCLSTNGLSLPEHVDDIVRIGVSHVTVTVNAVTPDVGGKIYAWVRHKNKIYHGEDGARILAERQEEGIRKLKEARMIVKINTVVIPGVNMDHVPRIAKKAKEWQADIMNCMAMIPVQGTPFANIKSPSNEEIRSIRKLIGGSIHQMTHCSRCRADACGKLCEG